MSLRYRININYLNVSRMRPMEIKSPLRKESGHPVSKYSKGYSNRYLKPHTPCSKHYLSIRKKKIWLSTVTCISFHRFSLPHGREAWKLAKEQGGILQTSSLPLQLPHARMGVMFVLPSGRFPNCVKFK